MSQPREHKPAANPWKSVSMVLMGILLGCAGSAAIDSPSVVHAEPRAAMFQHMCMRPNATLSGTNDSLIKAGTEGWELVTISERFVCFKRPA